MMNRKGPWEGYRQQAKSRPLSPSRLPLRAHFHRERERRLGTRRALNATDREEGIFIQLAFVYGLRYLLRDELSIIFHMM